MAVVATNAACWRCRWFEPDAGRTDDCGECHRHPRQGGLIDDEWVWLFPAVEYVDWCGEFEEET